VERQVGRTESWTPAGIQSGLARANDQYLGSKVPSAAPTAVPTPPNDHRSSVGAKESRSCQLEGSGITLSSNPRFAVSWM